MDASVLGECVVSIFRVKLIGENATRLNGLDDMKGG
jgi:hypothetical protein